MSHVTEIADPLTRDRSRTSQSDDAIKDWVPRPRAERTREEPGRMASCFWRPFARECSSLDSQSTHALTHVPLVNVGPDAPSRRAFGEKLREIRARAIDSGMRLLTEDEILKEVKRRRGESEDGEANVR